MIILDTNVVVYLSEEALSESDLIKIQTSTLSTCNVIVAEFLGYMPIKSEEEVYFRDLFKKMKNHPFNEEVTNKVIELRKTTNLRLPDAIIAATALVNNLELWTHNTKDFKKVQGLKLYDPIAN